MLLIRFVLKAFDTFTTWSVVTGGPTEHNHCATVRTHRPITGGTNGQRLFGEPQPGVGGRGRKHLDSVRESTEGGTVPFCGGGAPRCTVCVSTVRRRGPWGVGNVALGEYDDDEDQAVGRPPAPEDRTWRHPSEVAWEARQGARPVIAEPAEVSLVGTDPITDASVPETAASIPPT